jgi:hypothetical protein
MGIALDLLVQVLHGHPVKLSQFAVQDDFLIAQDNDPRRNSFGKHDCSFVHDAPESLRSQFVTSKILR